MPPNGPVSQHANASSNVENDPQNVERSHAPPSTVLGALWVLIETGLPLALDHRQRDAPLRSPVRWRSKSIIQLVRRFR